MNFEEARAQLCKFVAADGPVGKSAVAMLLARLYAAEEVIATLSDTKAAHHTAHGQNDYCSTCRKLAIYGALVKEQSRDA